MAIAEQFNYTGIKVGGISGLCAIRAVIAFGLALPVTEGHSKVRKGDTDQVCISETSKTRGYQNDV